MTVLTRGEVRANRQKWIDFLNVKGRKKAKSSLDIGDGARCCLGHACYVLGTEKVREEDGSYTYDGRYDYAPDSVVRMLGLWDETGAIGCGDQLLKVYKDDLQNHCSLAEINDNTSAGPNRIGKYLESVIEGGEDTPFRPLSEYPESI